MIDPVIYLLPDAATIDCPACGGTHRITRVSDGRVAVEDACPELRDMLNATGAVSFSIEGQRPA